MSKVNVLNIQIDNISKMQLLKRMNSGVLFTPNVDHLVKLQKDREFVKAYESADYKTCDSKVLMYTCRFLGTSIREKISGSDFFPAFCEYHKTNKDIKIFLLGAAKGIAIKAQEKTNKKIGRKIVVGAHSPSFGFENRPEECKEIIELVNASGATVLAIGVGAPKQEKWLYRYKHMLPNVKIFLAIGATIDFEAGKLKRAPKWVSEIGLEWLYRLLSEPRRLWKRYLVESLPFFWLVLKQKFDLYEPPSFKEQYDLEDGTLSDNQFVYFQSVNHASSSK